ncbi:MAG: HNH endonuclease signature motif containing protein [Chthoniobacter sp.]|nr:HNH endonuclease signature motif containing protein [Chthoniobacter sp.]
MSIQLTTIKRLFARSLNRCAMPRCPSPIVLNGIAVGEICHIKARNKKGPRYDPALTASEKDSYANLLLLCRTCHKRIDSDAKTFTAALLSDIKSMHEKGGGLEVTDQVIRDAELLFRKVKNTKTVRANAKGHGVAIAIGGDNHGAVNITHTTVKKASKSKYPNNSIGADANMAGYIDYLFGLGIDYWNGVATMTPGRLGKKIKDKFRLKARTRHHLPVQRFPELVDFIVLSILIPSPAGKRHMRNGTKLCRTFEEWQHGEM